MTDTTMIEGHTCRYHSDYKGWKIYRAIDGGQPRMCYFGIGFTDVGGLTTVTSRNLSGIKDKITEARR